MTTKIKLTIRPSSIYVTLLILSIAVSIAYPVASFAIPLYYITVIAGVLSVVININKYGLIMDSYQTVILVTCLLNILYCFLLYINADRSFETTYGRFISIEIITANMLIMTALKNAKINDVKFGKYITILGFASVLSTFIAFDRNTLMLAISRVVRLNGTVINGNMYAMVMTIVALFMVHSIVEEKKWRILKIAVLLVLFFLISLPSSRTALFTLFAGCILYFYFISPSNKKVMRIIQIALGVVLLLYLMSLFEGTSAILDRISTLWDRNDIVVANSDQSRWDLIRLGIEGWKEKPLLGQGFNSFGHRSSVAIGYSTYAHNNYVEVLYNTGAIGLILNYLPKLILMIKLQKIVGNDKTNRFNCALLSSLVVLLMYDMAVVSYYYLSLNYLWIIGASYILQNCSKPTEYVV